MTRQIGEEVHISLGDELIILDSELAQKRFRDLASIVLCLLGTKYNLEFQKIAKAFDGVDVDPSLPNQKENPGLFHFTGSTQRSRKNIEQDFWSRGICNLVPRTTRPGRVFAIILNQFAAVGFEHPQFESAHSAPEEEIVL